MLRRTSCSSQLSTFDAFEYDIPSSVYQHSATLVPPSPSLSVNEKLSPWPASQTPPISRPTTPVLAVKLNGGNGATKQDIKTEPRVSLSEDEGWSVLEAVQYEGTDACAGVIDTIQFAFRVDSCSANDLEISYQVLCTLTPRASRGASPAAMHQLSAVLYPPSLRIRVVANQKEGRRKKDPLANSSKTVDYGSVEVGRVGDRQTLKSLGRLLVVRGGSSPRGTDLLSENLLLVAQVGEGLMVVSLNTPAERSRRSPRLSLSPLKTLLGGGDWS